MIKATCGICKSEFQKDREDGPGCPVCGFGTLPQLQFVPYPVPYPVYPVYPQPYPWHPWDHWITVTDDKTIPDVSPKITWTPGVVTTSNTFRV